MSEVHLTLEPKGPPVLTLPDDGRRVFTLVRDVGHEFKDVVLRPWNTMVLRTSSGLEHTIHGRLYPTFWGVVDDQGIIVPKWVEERVSFHDA